MNATAHAKNVWHAALTHPIGVGVRVNDPQRAKNQLYAARAALAAAGTAGLDNFTIRTSPADPARELYIIRTTREAPDA